ncbi:GNAT family N-acetyltransferase [Cellulomonas denverensis]|uniref:GNAT family N-acetyltransferase n=1 Tax=Cellulomonas denverensis TaxID=264297 RepID=UPI0035E9AC3A
MFASYRPGDRGVPDPDIRLRPATGADLPGIVAVAESRAGVPAAFAERLAARLTDHTWRVLVADRPDDPAVLGWAMLGPWTGLTDAPDGRYVSALTVAPGARRRGIGDRLLAGLLAGEDGAVHSVINARNGASLDLHRRAGFTELGRAARFAGIDFDGGSGVLLRWTRRGTT